MLKKFITLSIIVFATSLFSQYDDINLSGTIVDFKSRKPLMGAEIYLENSGCGAVTGENGKFTLFCKNVNLRDTLIVSYLGYREEKIHLLKYADGSKIYLIPKSLELGDEIVISAEKADIIKQDIPHARTVIDLKEIERIGGSEISDLLKPVPSVRIEGNDLDGRRIQIRGSDADEVNVYLDGILLNNVRFDNAADLSIVPVENIESIEVLKGGNMALLGLGAFGGVVNITTRQETEATLFIKGKLGNYDNRYFIGSMNIPVTNRFMISYFGQLNEFSPQIEYFPDERFTEKTANDAITTEKQNHNVTMKYTIPSGQFVGNVIGYFLDYTKPFWESRYKNYLSSLTYKGAVLGINDFDIHVNHLHSRDNIERQPAGSVIYANKYQSNRLNLRLGKKVTYRAGEIQFLTEYFHDDLLTDFDVKDVQSRNNLYHAYLYDNRLSGAVVVSFDDYVKEIPTLSWKTYIGGRVDILANGDKDVTHMVGAQANYDLEKWRLTPYFNYGKNVKYPTLSDNAYVTDLIDPSRSDSSNVRLEPEYGNSGEVGIGVKYYPLSRIYHELNFNLAFFTRTVYNKLLKRPYDNLIANVQLGRNVTRGFETSLRFNYFLKYFNVGASYVQLDITDPLLYSYKPKNNLTVFNEFVAPFGLYFTVMYFYEGKSLAWYYDTEDKIQTEEIRPFNDMDLSLGFKIPFKDAEIELQFSGHNIFDNSGFRYYYLKKRYLQFSMSLRY